MAKTFTSMYWFLQQVIIFPPVIINLFLYIFQHYTLLLMSRCIIVYKLLLLFTRWSLLK